MDTIRDETTTLRPIAGGSDAAPATAEASAPAVSASGTPAPSPAPTEAAPSPGPAAPAPPPEGGTAEPAAPSEGQPAPAASQTVLRAIETQGGDLDTALDALFGPAEGTPPGDPASRPPVSREAPRAEPAPTPGAPAFAPITDQEIAALQQAYTDAPNDQAAFATLVRGVASLLAPRLAPADDRDPPAKWLDKAYEHSIHQATVQAAVSRQINTVVQTVEGWFEKTAPTVPIELIRGFYPEAQTRFPGDLKQQAREALRLAVRTMGPALDHAATAATEREAQSRATGVVLPGSGAGRVGGGEGERPKTMAEQMRALRPAVA
jgi:hypothetical protein